MTMSCNPLVVSCGELGADCESAMVGADVLVLWGESDGALPSERAEAGALRMPTLGSAQRAVFVSNGGMPAMVQTEGRLVPLLVPCWRVWPAGFRRASRSAASESFRTGELGDGGVI
jgi:hypothetical protein